MNWFRNYFNPSVEFLVNRELVNSRIGLLHAYNNLEAAQAQVTFTEAKVKRLDAQAKAFAAASAMGKAESKPVAGFELKVTMEDPPKAPTAGIKSRVFVQETGETPQAHTKSAPAKQAKPKSLPERFEASASKAG